MLLQGWEVAATAVAALVRVQGKASKAVAAARRGGAVVARWQQCQAAGEKGRSPSCTRFLRKPQRQPKLQPVSGCGGVMGTIHHWLFDASLKDKQTLLISTQDNLQAEDRLSIIKIQ